MPLASSRALTCRYCGAPLRAGPDDVVAVCRRCGRVNWLRGSPAPVLAVEALPKDELAARFDELALRDPELRREYQGVARVETVYFPFYAGVVRLRTRYRAYVNMRLAEAPFCKSGGEECLMIVEGPNAVEVEGEVEGVYHALIPARRVAGERVVGELARSVLALYREGGLEGPDAIDWGRADEVLAPQVTLEEARRRLRSEACDALLEAVREDAARRAEERLRERGVDNARVTRDNVEAVRAPCIIEEVRVEHLVYAPYSRVYYVAGDAVYRAYLYAWSGEPIEREEPFTDTQRMTVSILSGVLAAGGWTLAAAAAVYGGGGLFLLAAVPAVIASIVARDLYYGAVSLLYRVERGRGGSWLETLTETLRAVLRLRGSLASGVLGRR